jgi:hypothetical protein
MLLLGAVVSHRIYQITSGKKDIEKYESLIRLREANNHRVSFRDGLRRMSEAWSLSTEAGPQLTAGVLNTPRRRALRSTANVDHRKWGAAITGKTPAQNVKGFYESDPLNEEQKKIQERRKACMGLVMFRTHRDSSGVVNPKGKGARGACGFCKKPLTNVWCAGCHTWLCGPHIQLSSELGSSIILNAVTNPVTGVQTQICCRNSCWHEWHKFAYEKQCGSSASSVSTSSTRRSLDFD